MDKEDLRFLGVLAGGVFTFFLIVIIVILGIGAIECKIQTSMVNQKYGTKILVKECLFTRSIVNSELRRAGILLDFDQNININ